MSLDKAIKYGKEHRKPYRGLRPKSCRNHGNCSWCLGNRLFKFRDKHPGEMDIYNMNEAEEKENE